MYVVVSLANAQAQKWPSLTWGTYPVLIAYDNKRLCRDLVQTIGVIEVFLRLRVQIICQLVSSSIAWH